MMAQPQPVQVIEHGLVELRKEAWSVARNILSKQKATSNEALGYLSKVRQAAQYGDWMAKQLMTLVQTALAQQGGDPKVARYSTKAAPAVHGEATFSEEESIARSLVNRWRQGDQVATATLQQLQSGNGKARKIGTFAERLVARDLVTRHRAGDEVATATLQQLAGGNGIAKRIEQHANAYAVHGEAAFGLDKASQKVTLAAKAHPVAAKPTAQRHAAFRRTAEHHDAIGGQHAEPINGDNGLSVITGHVANPEAARLVNASRAGDRQAIQLVRDIGRAARAGDPRAQELGDAIHVYTKTHPEFGVEILEGHAANISHSHPLTFKRVKSIAATFGSETESSLFLRAVRSPEGPPSSVRPIYMGQAVGRAQAIQAARFPGASIKRVSEKAARELERL